LGKKFDRRATKSMTRVYILVEGQTEETFVKSLLEPPFAQRGLYLIPIIFATKPGYRGGVTSYDKVKRQILTQCKQEPSAWVTTFIDLYGLPSDFPGKHLSTIIGVGSGASRAMNVEQCLSAEIDKSNFIPFVMPHEFEALLFSDVSKFAFLNNPKATANLSNIAAQFANPEDINDSPQTAPSKRILALIPRYQKPLHGPQIASAIGLTALKESCPHFGQWISRLEQLAPIKA
jgi:hypothetical protein